MPGGVARRSSATGSGVAAAAGGAAAGGAPAAAAAAPGPGAAVARAPGAVDFHANVRGLSLGDRRELSLENSIPVWRIDITTDAVLRGGGFGGRRRDGTYLGKEKLGGTKTRIPRATQSGTHTSCERNLVLSSFLTAYVMSSLRTNSTTPVPSLKTSA